MTKGNRIRKQRQQVKEARQEAINTAATAHARVIVKCPTTDRFFPSEIVTNPASFNVSSFADNRTAECPLCGQMHVWGDSEVALDN